MNFQYVMSGMSFILPTNAVFNSDEFQALARKSIQWLGDSVPDSSFGMLFNAYTEKRIGQKLSKWNDIAKIYADSGGLQMVTQGLNATEADKARVYDVQAELSHFGMCFDEIPVVVKAERSSIQSGKDRYFDSRLFEQKAIETAANLKNQVRRFREIGTGCKPFIIAQGNSYKDFRQWTRIVVDELGELSDDIGGVAFGSSALGRGELEDYIRAHACATLDAPDHIKKHVHILGVGSIQRLIPMIASHYDGLVSYDSVTHSSADSFFVYQGPDRKLGYKHGNMNDVPAIVADITRWNEKIGFYASPEDIRRILITQRSETAFTPESRWQYDTLKFLIGLYNVRNFMGTLDDLRKQDTKIIENLNQKRYNLFRTFKNVKDDAQFDEWRRTVGRHATSQPFPNAHPSSLAGLFG